MFENLYKNSVNKNLCLLIYISYTTATAAFYHFVKQFLHKANEGMRWASEFCENKFTSAEIQYTKALPMIT